MDVKKVLFVFNTTWSLYNFRFRLMRALKERGFDVCAVVNIDDYTSLIEKEFQFIPLRILHRKSKNTIKELKLLFECNKLYTYHKPSLVINFTLKPNIYENIASKLAKVKSISSVTGFGYVFI